MTIQWTESMSVGVPELDEDHKGLIDIINRLAHQSNLAGVTVSVEKSLVALVRYAEIHFAREERVMSVCGYAQSTNHIEAHRTFVGEIQKISRRFENDPEGLAKKASKELDRFLSNWLSNHILHEDMAYKPYVETNQQNARKAALSVRGSHVWWSR